MIAKHGQASQDAVLHGENAQRLPGDSMLGTRPWMAGHDFAPVAPYVGPGVSTQRSASMKRPCFQGLSLSRRPDSNRGPLHYEGTSRRCTGLQRVAAMRFPADLAAPCNALRHAKPD